MREGFFIYCRGEVFSLLVCQYSKNRYLKTSATNVTKVTLKLV